MSPRAAWRLESLGFTSVYDFVPGKAAWLAMGLPREGRSTDVPNAGEVADPDVPTCLLSERIGEVRGRMTTGNHDICVVLHPEGVVMGRLRGEALPVDRNRRPRMSVRAASPQGARTPPVARTGPSRTSLLAPRSTSSARSDRTASTPRTSSSRAAWRDRRPRGSRPSAPSWVAPGVRLSDGRGRAATETAPTRPPSRSELPLQIRAPVSLSGVERRRPFSAATRTE
jgi:hypothetical protein